MQRQHRAASSSPYTPSARMPPRPFQPRSSRPPAAPASARRAAIGPGPRPNPPPWRSAVAGSFCRHFRQIVSSSRGVFGCNCRGRTGSSDQHLHDRVQRGRPLERRPARQALVQDRPQRIDVRRRPDVRDLAAGLLRGHVARRAHDRAGRRQARFVQLLGQAEVRDLGRAVLRQQHVGRLQVAVNDPLLVGRLHGPGQRLDQPRRLGRRQRRAIEFLVQAPPGQNSMEKNGMPSCSPTSWTWTMLGCCKRATASASMRKRARSSSPA